MLCIDIETVPVESSLLVPYDPATNPPPANYKSAEAIDGWHAKGAASYTESRIKACSVNPRLGRILCVGWQDDTTNGVDYAETEADEANVLAAFWERVPHHKPIVTWNGAFDLRYLVIRSLKHGITPSIVPAPWFKKYTTLEHFDVKAVLMNWDVKVSGEGLDEWSRFFGVGAKTDGWDGSKVYPAYLAGRHAEIAAYCADDVAATAALYQIVRQMA